MNVPFAADARIVELDPSQVTVSRWNPRQFHDASSKEHRELVHSIRAIGQSTPALVVRAGNEFELLTGTRRLTAVRELNFKLKAIVINDLPPAEKFKQAHAENSGRSALSFWEESVSYATALNGKLFSTEADLAAAVGRARSTVNRALALVNAPPEILSLFPDKAEISMRQWAAFAPLLGDEEARARILACAARLRQQSGISANAIFSRLAAAANGKAPPAVIEVRNEFNRRLATIRGSSTGGISVAISSMREMHPSQRNQALTRISSEIRTFVDGLLNGT